VDPEFGGFHATIEKIIIIDTIISKTSTDRAGAVTLSLMTFNSNTQHCDTRF
jgi:hypothetical protein